MEAAFVAVAKAQAGDESSQLSSSSPGSESTTSLCRSLGGGGGSATAAASAATSPTKRNHHLSNNSHNGNGHLPHHIPNSKHNHLGNHVDADASPTSGPSVKGSLDNGPYWKYLGSNGGGGGGIGGDSEVVGGDGEGGSGGGSGESNNNINHSGSAMVPQEPTMATNDGVSKTPSPSSVTSVIPTEDHLRSTSVASPTDHNNLITSSNVNFTSTNPAFEEEEEEEEEEEDEGDDRTSSPINNNISLSTKSKQRMRSSGSISGGGGRLETSSVGGSDVEKFDGKIVYNPDGSAYIIEDSELSEDDTTLDVPHLEGCIVDDSRGMGLSQIPAIPQIANAFYVSRNPALYNALYGGGSQAATAAAYSSLLSGGGLGGALGGGGGGGSGVGGGHDKKQVPDKPIMHSYRVYSIRDNKCGDSTTPSASCTVPSSSSPTTTAMPLSSSEEKGSSGGTGTNGPTDGKKDKTSTSSPTPSSDSVPVKPILMCFICKLSFGYTKSFIAHAMGDHNLILIDQEKDVLNQRNVSAIIQPVGKNKDPTISFLEPVMSTAQARLVQSLLNANVNQQQQQQSSVPISRALLHSSSGNNNNSSNNSGIPLVKATDLPVAHRSPSSSSSAPTGQSQSHHHHQSLFRNLSNASSSSSSDDNLIKSSSLLESPTGVMDRILSSPSPRQSMAAPMDILQCTPPPRMSSSSSSNPGNPGGLDLTRKGSPASGSGRSSASPGAGNVVSPAPSSSTPNTTVNNLSPTSSQILTVSGGGGGGGGPPNFITGTTIGVCPEHMNGRPSGVDCSKCEMILNSSRMGALGNLHTRNSCKTLKCPKCNWHYKYQETLEIHMKEKHPDNETSCIYCIAGQPHPRLARGETYTCGYKPYRCEVCNYSTTTKGNLSIHMQSDKHLNNMQELQNGGVPPPESLVQQQVPPPHPHGGGGGGKVGSVAMTGMSPSSASVSQTTPSPQQPKPKPTFRCDVCNYETNVARNLRIHMTSEKHTHNMMVLQQNVKHMQHLSALQQAQNPFDPATLFQLHPQLQQMAAAAAAAANAAAAAQQQQQQQSSGRGGGDGREGSGSEVNVKATPHAEAALADMAYNQALLIQMMTGGQMPPHIPPELAPHIDLGLNPDTMEPPPEPPDPNPTHLFQCCVCTVYSTDSLESLSHHLTQDRTKLREQEILVMVAGNYMCKLCSYKTNLKANFQLHCKTDKHLQRLQHVNHVKEGGVRNEWKLKYLSMSNPVQVRCNACDYYTNSAHKLQLHAAHQRHEISVLIFRHIQSVESNIHEDARIYACALCGFTTRVKLQLLQHTRSLKHVQLEQLHCLQRRAEGKDGQPDLAQVFRVLEQPDADSSGLMGHHNNNNHSSSSASADVSPNFFDEQEMKRDSSSVLKNALEKDSDMNDLNCPFCTFTSDSESRLQAHILTQHSNSDSSMGSGGRERDRERLRDRDPSTLSSSSSIARHHHRNSISPDGKADNLMLTPGGGGGSSGARGEGMTCPLCQDVCSDRSSLELHVMQVHSVNAEGLQRLLLLVNQSHWLNTSSTSRSSAANNISSNSDMRSDSNDEDKDNKSEGESALEDCSDSDEFKCSTCSKCFRTLDELCCHQNEMGHLEIKQTPGGPGYLCWKKGCNQYFGTVTSLQLHFREIHARGKPAMAVSEKHVYKFRCSDCSLAFKTSEKLQLHSQYHAIRDASKCPLCGRSFRSVSALLKHVESSHSELSDEELLLFKQNLANNPLLLAGLSGQILDPLTTELLKKESARDDDMMMMMEEEGGQDSFSGDRDDTGGRGGGDRDGMNESGGEGDSNDSIIGSKEQQLFEDYLNTQAMAEDSYNDPHRKYKCHRCKVAFTRQSYLTSHNKTLLHRKGEKLSYPMEKYLDPNRPFKCEICKESFTQKNILLVHYNSVSHLHKLKKAMQEQQQLLGQIPSSLTASLPPSVAGLVTGSSSSSASATATAPKSSTPSSSTTATTPPSPAITPSLNAEEDDKKPYKCNICKVAYSQGSTLDIHMRSVLHQTRASKLQELAMTGQIDLTKPLIEQPELGKGQDSLQQQIKKVKLEMLSPHGESVSGAPVSFSTPIRSSSPMSNRSQTPNNTTPPNTSVSPIASSSPTTTFSCSRCNFACNSQEQLVQHQHLYCMFHSSMSSLFPPLPSPATTPTGESHGMEHPSPASSPCQGGEESYQRFTTMPSKKSSQMFKHLLESYGFEMVMQFNEYHQKRLRRRSGGESEEEGGEMLDEQMVQDFPELAKATCPFCKKVFSSVWILKAHCEEIHKHVISMEILENFAEAFRTEYLKKLEAAAASCPSGGGGEGVDLSEEMMSKEAGGSVGPGSGNPGPSSSLLGGVGGVLPLMMKSASAAEAQQGNNNNSGSVNPTAPSTPTASTTPGSSADSVSGNNSSSAAGGHSSSNVPMSLAQHMNDVQAALNAMAASAQLQHFNPMLNPMMMASLGMALPLGLNMNALAAMNLQPPLVPMMMPPGMMDPMNQMNQMNQSQTPPHYSQQRDQSNAIAKQQQQMMQQQQQAAAAASSAAAAASQQKRARTRITDEQLKILRAHFDINNSPSEEQIQQMASQSGLPPKVIKHWFRNTLFKERQRNKDSPYNFSNPPSTTLNLEEYEKTGEAKVTPLPFEEQSQYVNLPSTTTTSSSSGNKKEGGGKSKQQQQHHHHQQQQQPHPLAHHLLQFQQQDLPLDMKYMNSHDSQSELSETESRHEDDVKPPPSKSRSSGKGGRSGSPSVFGLLNATKTSSSSVPEPTTSSSPGSLTLSSLITSQLNPNQQDETSRSSSMSMGMLPPPKMSSNFATPSQVPNASLLSLASPVSINSPGSGRSDTPMTTPPLPTTTNNNSCANTPVPTSAAQAAAAAAAAAMNSSSSSSSSGKRANRTRFTDYQIKVLQEFFENNAYPKDDDLEYLSKLLSLSPRVIVVWFQNARQKARKVYENQPPVDTASGAGSATSGDENTGRFQRTPGLNYQCKKCLLVFQRYYELIRHQKTHCFKEEDAKRSAQAQAAAAQVAAAMSSEDSNSSTVTDNNSLASSCGPSPVAAGSVISGGGGGGGGRERERELQSGRESANVSQPSASANNSSNNNAAAGVSSLFASELKKLENQDSFQCDKCNLVFPRFDLWREHQLVHIMNPNLFPSFSPDSPFGILQQHAAHIQQQQQQQLQQLQQQQQGQGQSQSQTQQSSSQREREMMLKETFAGGESNSATSSVAGDATAKRKWSADDVTDDDNNEQPRDKRLRTTILPEQLDYLYQKYQIESNPSRKMLETIAREVGLKKRVVQVWFQNTRARERKGQFRAHAQVINKRCPFCPALFKVKSALETHLAAKHADQYTKGDINIDALPDEEIDSASSPLGDNTKVPISFGANSTNSLGAASVSPPPPSTTNLMAPFLHSLSTHAELESSLKKLYEESLKRYAQEVQAASQNGCATPASGGGGTNDLRFIKGELASPSGNENPAGGDSPLDLSKPVDLTRALAKAEPMDTSFLDSQDYLSGESDDESLC